jgi:hypothetical protein
VTTLTGQNKCLYRDTGYLAWGCSWFSSGSPENTLIRRRPLSSESFPLNQPYYLKNKGKAVPVTGRGGPYGCETSRLQIFSRQSAHRWRWGCQPYAPATLYPQEDSWYSLLLQAESTEGPSAAGGIRSVEKCDDLIGNQTLDLRACSVVVRKCSSELRKAAGQCAFTKFILSCECKKGISGWKLCINMLTVHAFGVGKCT